MHLRGCGGLGVRRVSSLVCLSLCFFTGLPCDDQRVIFNGKQLEDSDLLTLAGVEEEATLNILGRLLGGAKKRKKKTYTKPKKQKHKHKKIKLRVLKFYKVSGKTCAHSARSAERHRTSVVKQQTDAHNDASPCKQRTQRNASVWMPQQAVGGARQCNPEAR